MTSPRSRRRAGLAPSALVRSVGSGVVYDLLVIATDVADTVSHAGGWICDRSRAGWRVNVIVPPSQDHDPLLVLGANTSADGAAFDALPHPKAVAFAARELSAASPWRSQLLAAMRRRGTEVTIWGDGTVPRDARFHAVRHRPGPAAQAFKRSAVHLAGLTPSSDVDETFRACRIWYPLHSGGDFMLCERR